MPRSVSVILFAGLLASCASIPDVEYTYYPAKMDLVVTASQTVDCSKDNKLIVGTTPTIHPSYSAYRKGEPFHINIQNITGPYGTFADSDAKFIFYDDGRLKSINQNTTGQGEAVIKAAATLATTVASLSPAGFAAFAAEPPCTVIKNWGKGKAVNLTYASRDISSINDKSGDRIYLSNVLGKTFDLPATPGSRPLYKLLRAKLPKLRVTIGDLHAITGAAHLATKSDAASGDFVPLHLQNTSVVRVEVKADKDTISSADVVVPEPGSYVLPIPTAALFGKQTFSLDLSDAGSITTVDYGNNSGAAGALNAANAVATTQTPATKAAALNAEANLIAAQHRLMACQTNPAECK